MLALTVSYDLAGSQQGNYGIPLGSFQNPGSFPTEHQQVVYTI